MGAIRVAAWLLGKSVLAAQPLMKRIHASKGFKHHRSTTKASYAWDHSS
jgi:hypothetical protein